MSITLGTMHIIAESLTINRGGATITNTQDILVKEGSNVNDKSVWDEEW